MNVLIVDDHPANLMFLRTLLEREGHTVREAPDGIEALADLERGPTDAIISDILMPRMDGYRLCYEVRHNERLCKTPIIIYTATYTSPADETLALHVGANKYVRKPATTSMLMAALHEATSNGTLPVPCPRGPLDEVVVLKEYSERVVAKLEEKNIEMLVQTTALEAAANGITITDSNGGILWVNPAFTTLTGYSAEEVINKTPRILKSGIQDDEFYRDFWKTIQSGQTWHGEFVNRRNDGTLFVGEQTVTPVRASQGEITHYISVMQDVTERKRMQDELAERAALSALGVDIGTALAEALPMRAILQTCTEAIVSRVNAAFARIWTLDDQGETLELQASAGLYTHIDGSHARVPVGKFKIGRIAKERKPHLTNSVIGDPNVPEQDWAKQEGLVSFAGYPIVFDGRLVGVMAMFSRFPLTDFALKALGFIAEQVGIGLQRKQGELALRQAQERLQRAVSAGTVGLWDWDLRTNQTYFSPEWKRQIGYDEDEIGSDYREWESRLHPSDSHRMHQIVEDVIAKVTPSFSDQFRIRHKDGSYRWILTQGAPLLDDQKRPVRLLGANVDITERKRLEEQFLQAQKVESVGRLAGGVAHDFNNLLTVILGYAEFAIKTLKEGDPLRNDLKEIRNAGERAAGLTRQLLAFSRKQVLQPEVLDLNTIISAAEKMLGRLIGEDIELAFVPAADLDNVKVDPGQIEQVIMNLAVNARDAMPAGGKLTIETSNQVLDEEYAANHMSVAPGSYVLLSISDTGTGMDAATLERMFEPFFTTKDVGKGTGLGLATVHGIVKQSGGNVFVYSEVGKGTVFKIYLPRVKEEPANRTTTLEAAERGTETILVVEDEEMLRSLTRRILISAGYTALTAANGDEALLLLKLQTTHVDLVITDVVMPGMSGRDLEKQLTAIAPNLKILFMSGYTDDAIVRHNVLEANTHFISKPFTPMSLSRKIREVLAN